MRGRHRGGFMGNTPRLGTRRSYIISPVFVSMGTFPDYRAWPHDPMRIGLSAVAGSIGESSTFTISRVGKVWGRRIRVQWRSIIDEIAPLKSDLWKGWGEESGVTMEDLGWLREWGSKFPQWDDGLRSCWRNNGVCSGDCVYWMAKVLSSQWWCHRVRHRNYFLLPPKSVWDEAKSIWDARTASRLRKGELKASDWKTKFLTSRIFGWEGDRLVLKAPIEKHWHALKGSAVYFSIPEGPIGGFEASVLLCSAGRGMSSLPPMRDFIAFIERFWGKERASELEALCRGRGLIRDQEGFLPRR